MQQPGVTFLALLHSGVSTHVNVPLTEAGRSFGAETLDNGSLAAGGEELDTQTHMYTTIKIGHALTLLRCTSSGFRSWF